jgi:hypothetical protein
MSMTEPDRNESQGLAAIASVDQQLFDQAAAQVGGAERLNAMLDHINTTGSPELKASLQKRLNDPQGYANAVDDLSRLCAGKPTQYTATGAKDHAEFVTLMRAAANGDADAAARVQSTTREVAAGPEIGADWSAPAGSRRVIQNTTHGKPRPRR